MRGGAFYILYNFTCAERRLALSLSLSLYLSIYLSICLDSPPQSSFGELEYACAPYRPAGGTDDRPTIKPWDPAVASVQEFPITTYQPVYFLAESLNDAKSKMRTFCEGLQKPFLSRHNPNTDEIWVDRPVKRSVGVPDNADQEGVA